MSARTCDVLVIGAGPAGATAARDLARGGAHVVLIEKARLPRYKTCGGGVVRRAAGWLPEEARAVFEVRCARAEFHLFDGERELGFTVDEPEIVQLAMRAELDNALVGAARAAGVEVLAPCALLELDNGAERVRAHTEGGAIEARLAIAADGATGRAARLAGWSEPLATVPALEWEVRVPPEVHARFAASVRFDFGAIPRGYAWVFPKREHLSVGALSMRRGESELARALEAWLARIGLAPLREVERHGYVIPVRPRAGGCARGRVLLAGDAAGLVDPLTAEGISHALASGRFAASAALAARFDPSGTRERFVRALRRSVLRELAWARMAARFLYRDPPPRRLFRAHGQALCRAMAAVVTGRTSYRALFLDPRNYLRLARPTNATPRPAQMASGAP